MSLKKRDIEKSFEDLTEVMKNVDKVNGRIEALLLVEAQRKNREKQSLGESETASLE